MVCIMRLHWPKSASIFGSSFSALISFRSWPAQKPLPVAARMTTRVLLSFFSGSNAS